MPEKADCIVGFGNFNDNIARRAAELYLQEHSRSVFINVRVFPNAAPVSSASELTEAADRENAENKGPDYILPSTVNGREVIWQEKKNKMNGKVS